MADTPDEKNEGSKPSYLSFVTLTNFFDKFAENPPPPQVDKSYLDSYSGANQAMLVSTLRTMGLIDAKGNVDPKLVEIAKNKAARKAFFAEKLPDLYPGLVELAEQNGTAQQLETWFRKFGYQGSTLRKSVLFYLAAAEYAGLPRSPHFKAPKAPAGGTGQRGRNGSRGRGGAGEQEQPETPTVTPTTGETITAVLGDAGTVTLTVDVRWLSLDDDTVLTIRKLTRELRELHENFDFTEEETEEEVVPV